MRRHVQAFDWLNNNLACCNWFKVCRRFRAVTVQYGLSFYSHEIYCIITWTVGINVLLYVCVCDIRTL